MKPFVRETLLRQRVRLQELDALLSAPDVVQDLARFRLLSREHTQTRERVAAFGRYEQREADQLSAQALLLEPDMADLARDEIARRAQRLHRDSSRYRRR